MTHRVPPRGGTRCVMILSFCFFARVRTLVARGTSCRALGVPLRVRLSAWFTRLSSLSGLEHFRRRCPVQLRAMPRSNAATVPFPCTRAESLPPVLFFFQAEDGIRDLYVTGVQTCALPI